MFRGPGSWSGRRTFSKVGKSRRISTISGSISPTSCASIYLSIYPTICEVTSFLVMFLAKSRVNTRGNTRGNTIENTIVFSWPPKGLYNFAKRSSTGP